jgi:type I restriction enzyme S subunit
METEIIQKKEIKRDPKLRFREFEQKWHFQKLSELLTFKNGLNSEKEKYGTGVKFINVLDIINNDFITYDKIQGSVEVNEKEFEKNKVSYGDILFQRSSETREEVGQANVYLDEKYNAVFGGFVIRGKGKTEYSPRFMNYLLKTSSARKEITTKSGGSTRYNVGQETLSNVYITTTTLPEQQKIAFFLSEVDKKIQQLTRKKELLETYKKGVIQQLFSQQLRFKPALSEAEGDENGKDFPDWEEKKLKEVCTVNPKNSELPETFIYIDLESVNSGRLIKENRISSIEAPSRAQRVLEENDILFQTVRPYQMNNLFFDKKGDYIASTGYAQLRVTENPMFLFQLIHSEEFVNKVLKRCTGTSYPAINSNDLAKIKVFVPTSNEQQKIAKFLSKIDIKIEAVSQQITKTQSFKKGLLQQMFV